MAFGTGTPLSAEDRLNNVRNAMDTITAGGAIRVLVRAGAGGEQHHYLLSELLLLEKSILKQIANEKGPQRTRVEFREPA